MLFMVQLLIIDYINQINQSIPIGINKQLIISMISIITRNLIKINKYSLFCRLSPGVFDDEPKQGENGLQQVINIGIFICYKIIQAFKNLMTSRQKTKAIIITDVIEDSNTKQEQQFSLQDIERILDEVSLENVQTPPSTIGMTVREQQFELHQKIEINERTKDEEQLSLKDIIISRPQITFNANTLYPGSVDEIDFSVEVVRKEGQTNEDNTQEQFHVLRVIAICNNTQFNDLDQYVFSVRGTRSFEYFQEVRYKIRRGERADIKAAVKIPQLQQNYTVSGVLEVRIENLDPIIVPMTAKCTIPQIICLKQLYKQDEESSILRVPAKCSQQRTPSIPFKNLTPSNITFEVEALSLQDCGLKPYDIVVQNFVHAQANTQFFVNMQLKQNINYTESVMPSRYTIRKILVLRIRNTVAMLHFPLEVIVFEGQGLDSN